MRWMGIGRILDIRLEWGVDLIWGGKRCPTSFLRQVDGAVGGVAAGLEEGGEAGEELPFFLLLDGASVMDWEGLRLRCLGDWMPLVEESEGLFVWQMNAFARECGV